jgi:cytochrome P450
MSTQQVADGGNEVPWFDPGDPDTMHDPFPVMERIRKVGPFVRWHPRMWVTTKYSTVRNILRHPAFSQGDLNEALKLLYGPDFDGMAHPAYRWLSQAFVMQDPPDHTRIRALVTGALTARRVRELEPAVVKMSEQLIDEFADRDHMELLHDFAYRLPSRVMARLLGITEKECDEKQMMRLNESISRIFVVFEPRVLSPEELALADREIEFFYRFVKTLFENRLREPLDDMLTTFLTKPREEGGMTADELDNIVISFFGAGFETTAHLIVNTLLALDDWPEQRALLTNDLSRAGDAVEEALRHSNSLNAIYRYVSEDTEIEGQQLRSGDRVLLLLSAANRDPEQYPEPDKFDLTRPTSKPLSFGFGIHHCVGAELARMEATVALRVLFRRLPKLRVDRSQEIRWRNTFFFHGLEKLEVRWD